MTRYAAAAVATGGGSLHVGRWRGDGGIVPVLAVHGVTAHHLSWSWLAAALPDRELIAPDLRGRGRSRQVAGPYGMAAHAEDLVRVLDHVGHSNAVLVGHSMGAFVALVLAYRHPDRVAGLVLVDGGLPLPVPPGMEPDEVAEAVIGPSLRRLEMRFTNVDEHRALWRQHPALSTEWGPALAAYADADLHGSPPRLTSRTVREAVDTDSRDLLTGTPVRDAQAALSEPAVMLRAAEGMAAGAPPLYDQETAASAGARYPALELSTVPEVNHYTIVMSDRGAHTLARVVSSAPGR